MKFNKIILPFALLLSLTSCGGTTSSPSFDDSNDIPTEIPTEVPTEIPTETPTETPTDEPSKVYEKDEEGFFILENEYFSSYSQEDGKKQSKLKYSGEVPNMTYSSYFRLYVGENRIPIYSVKVNNSHSWYDGELSRMENGVAIINLEGCATFKLQTSFLINNIFEITPKVKKVNYEIDEDRRVVTFDINSNGQYTLEFRGGRTLHLFVNPYEGYENLTKYQNVIRFKKGVHTKSNNSYIDSNNTVSIPSNTTVILEPGSIVEAKFAAYKKENIQIIGDGIVLGANFKRSPITGDVTVPFDFSHVKNLEFAGISALDPAGWCYNIYFCDNVFIDDIKIISSRHNGDGISMQSTSNVVVEDSFLRTWDDSLVVKNYPLWENRNVQGTTRNHIYRRCLIWTDLAQSMEIGFETVGQTLEDITFEDIIVLHNYHKAPISIHNGNNAHVKDIEFKNITIEEAKVGLGDGWNRLIDISNEYSTAWSEKQGHTSLGEMDGVLLKNIYAIDGTQNPLVKVHGAIDPREEFSKEIHYVKNVQFIDVKIYDEILTETYSNFKTKYVQNVTVTQTGNEITGCSTYWTENHEYGKNIMVDVA